MKLSDIVVGKTYRIKSWETMASEHGLSAVGAKSAQRLSAPAGICQDDGGFYCFVDTMRGICGMDFTPKEIRNGILTKPSSVYIISEEGVENRPNNLGTWKIQPWMLEEIPEEINEPDKDLFGFLFS